MMRQSPKPYAKGKERLTPPCPRCGKYCQGRGDLSTLLCVDYLIWDRQITHLWGSVPTNHPFVLLAVRPMSNAELNSFDYDTSLLKSIPITQSPLRTKCRAPTQ
jgi:hypothetical protein